MNDDAPAADLRKRIAAVLDTVPENVLVSRAADFEQYVRLDAAGATLNSAGLRYAIFLGLCTRADSMLTQFTQKWRYPARKAEACVRCAG